MIIEATLQEVSGNWIALKLKSATQLMRLPIDPDQSREIAGALGRQVTITVRAADVPIPVEPDDALPISFESVRTHARLLAESAASLDVRALARLVEALQRAITGVGNAVTATAGEWQHDAANTSMAIAGVFDLAQTTQRQVEAFKPEIDALTEAVRALTPAPQPEPESVLEQISIFPTTFGAPETPLIEAATAPEAEAAPAPVEEPVPVIEDAIVIAIDPPAAAAEQEPTEPAPEQSDPPPTDSTDTALDVTAEVTVEVEPQPAADPDPDPPAPMPPAPDDQPTQSETPSGRRKKR
jgi:hypothetical protein